MTKVEAKTLNELEDKIHLLCNSSWIKNRKRLSVKFYLFLENNLVAYPQV